MTKWQVRVKYKIYNEDIFYDTFYIMAESKESAHRLALNKVMKKPDKKFIPEKIDVFPANLRKEPKK